MTDIAPPPGFTLDAPPKPPPGFNLDEDRKPQDYFTRNRAWMKSGSRNFYTDLSDDDEKKFQSWVKANKVPNDDSPHADYDMRGFWKALEAKDPKAVSAIDPNDKRLHYPDYWKTPYHETFSAESKWADPTKAPKWNAQDQLVAPDGKVVFDDRAQPGKKPDRIGEFLKGQEEGGKALAGGFRDVAKFAGDVARRQKEDFDTGYADKPGYTYGSVLPFRQNDATGEIEWGYSPEAARAAIRGAGHTLDFDINNPQHRADVMATAAATAGLNRGPGMMVTPRPPGAVPPRVEPPPPGGPRLPPPAPPAGFTLDEAGITPTPEPTPGAPKPGSASLEEAGIRPTPEPPPAPAAATETETIAVPQADATVQQVQVRSGEPPPPPAEPPAPGTESPAPGEMNPADLRAGFPDLSDEQFEALFQQANREVPRPTTTDPADQSAWMKAVMGTMARLGVPAAAPAPSGDPWAPVAVAPVDQPEAETPIPQAAPAEPGAEAAPEPGQAAAPSPEAPQPDVASPQSPAIEAHGGPWTQVLDEDGQPKTNYLGDAVLENPQGVRAVMDGNVPWTEATKEVDGKLVPKNPGARKRQHLTSDEPWAEPIKKETETGTQAKPKQDKPIKKPAEAEKPRDDWKKIGENEEGDALFANEQGVHSIVKDGVRIVEKVRLRPTAGGMEMSVPPAAEKEPEFRPALEKPESGPEPGQNQAKGDAVETPKSISTASPTEAPTLESDSKGTLKPLENESISPEAPTDSKPTEGPTGHPSSHDWSQMVAGIHKDQGHADASDVFHGLVRANNLTPAQRGNLLGYTRAAIGDLTWTPEPEAEAKPEAPKPSEAGWPPGELADAWQRGRDDAAAGKPSIGTRIPQQDKSQAYIEGYHSVAPTTPTDTDKPADVGTKPTAPRAYKGIYYFPTAAEAERYATAVGAPTDRIIEYERGHAIQMGVSGPYVGPDYKPAASASPESTPGTKDEETAPVSETAPAPTPAQTPEEALASADAAYKAHYPAYQQAKKDHLDGKISDDEYFAVYGEHQRLRDAVDAAQDAIPDEDQIIERRRVEAGIEQVALNDAYSQSEDKALEPQMDDIRDMLKNGWSPGDIAVQPGIDRTPREIRALQHMWREDGQLPWGTRAPEQPELPEQPATQKEKYDALYPSDTPAATGKPDPAPQTSWAPEVYVEGKWSRNSTRFATQEEAEAAARDIHSRWMMAEDSRATEATEPPNYRWEPGTGIVELKATPEAPTSEADGTGSGAGPGDSGLGQPGSGQIRTPRPGSRSSGRGGRGQGLAQPQTSDVPTAEAPGNFGEDGVRPEPVQPGSDEQIPDSGNAADGRTGAGGSGVDDAGTGGGPGPELDLSDPGEIQPPTITAPEVDISAANVRPNFFVSEPERMVGGTPKVRFARNRRAIEAFRDITDEGRQPTEAELETMAGFTGWGSFGQDLFQGTFERPVPRQGWDAEGQWLREHLGPEGWRAAQASIRNAHYTDPPTVQAMWDMVRQMGFNGGRVLEPSMGVGNFFGLMPRDLMAQSTLTGIELEPTTGGMAQLLYPQAGVFIKGFQESQTPDNFYDLVIGNWPFDATPPADRRYNRLKPTLHDYFYLKALDQTRPGGLVVGITSAGTMDKMDRLARMEMAKKGELIASFRLPTGAFEQYAGTAVVTDIIILRKRTEPLTDAAAEEWIETQDMDAPHGKIRVNQYYHDHPENVLGTLDWGHGTTSGRPGMIVDRPADLMARLQSLPAKLPADAYQPKTRGGEPRFITNNTADRNQSVVVGKDGNLYQVAGERLLRLDDVHAGMKSGSAKIQKQRADQIKDLVAMRKAYGGLIDAERDASPEAPAIRKALNDLYQAYTKANPKQRLVETAGMRALKNVEDPNWPILAALQRPDGTPAAILSGPVVRSRRVTENPSVPEAYVMARNESANLDIDRVAEMARRPVEDVARELEDAGAILRTPGGGYEPSDGYLSGNVRRKLREAEDAVERGEPMQKSVEALQKVIPANTPYYQIEAKFGAPWVSDKDYQRFIAEHLLDLPEHDWPHVDVKFVGGKWQVNLEPRLNHTIEAEQTHGHPRYRFDRLLTAALGNMTPRIMDPKDQDGGPYYNATASEEVATRIQEVREKFQDWVWRDAERTVRLEQAFNDTTNAIAKPHYDGSFMDMSGMALQRGDDPFNLRRHQLAAIWRGVSLGRGAFFHEVGTGKTYTIGGIAIEGRRYGKWNKPLLLAHNANSRAAANEIQQMYPGAKILYLDSDDLTPSTLKSTMYQVRNEDWDLVVMQHSHLKKLALKRETLMGLAREQITAMEDELYAAAAEDGVNLANVNLNDEKDIEKKIQSVTAKNLAKQRLKILNTIEAQAQRASSPDAIPFEDLGIDAIFIDEAQVFKKPPIATRMRIKGLNTEASTISIGLDFLTKYVKNNNNGNGVFLFTGTPVTNSLNEIFNMARYFMDDTMKRDGIGDWDTWFNTFADALNDVELTSTGDYESIRRLSSFVNVDELVRVMSQFTDVVQASDMPEFVDRSTPVPTGSNTPGKTLSSPDLTTEERDFLENGRTENPTGRPYKRVINDVGEILPEQAIIQNKLRQEMRDFKTASPAFRKANKHIPVVIEGNLTRASLDARMYEPSASENPNNKINRVAKNVLEIYQTPQAAQMIFVDNGYNPGKLNPNFAVIPDLIDKLVKGGIPRKEIAVVAGKLKPEQKAEIARKMNNGEIRVAIGQSNTLGVGVNAQEHLRAMHHMDAPWMPGELEQRNGRGHRHGNAWNTVLEYRYITEGLDGKRWQVLTIKDRFIKQFIGAFNDESGKRIGVIEGEAADISEKEDIVGTLSAAAGDPRLLQKEKLKADVDRLERRERVHQYGTADAADRARRMEVNVGLSQASRDRREGHIATWMAAQSRMEAEAREAGSKVRWYDAVIDGQPLNTAEDIQKALDKRVSELAQNEGEVKIGTINGLSIVAEWGKGWTEPQYALTDNQGNNVDGMSALTMPRIIGRIQALKNDLDSNPDWREQMQSDIAKLKKAADQPFTQGPALLKKRQQLAQIEDDMQENPIPPPAWLRHGAPIDTPIWVDGQERIVRGHRMTDDYYLSTDEGDVPYMQVTDKNGFNVFTQKPRPPTPLPKDLPAWARLLVAEVPGETQVIWHRGDLVLARAVRDGDEVFLGFKKGLTEDQQAWNVYGMRGAFDVKDIDKMRSEAESWRARERNRKALEQAQQPKPEPAAPPPSETPWAGLGDVDPVTRRMLEERAAQEGARLRELAAKWIQRQSPGRPI